MDRHARLKEQHDPTNPSRYSQDTTSLKLFPIPQWLEEDMLHGDSKLRAYLLLNPIEDQDFINFKYAREGLGKFRLYVVSYAYLLLWNLWFFFSFFSLNSVSITYFCLSTKYLCPINSFPTVNQLMLLHENQLFPSWLQLLEIGTPIKYTGALSFTALKTFS